MKHTGKSSLGIFQSLATTLLASGALLLSLDVQASDTSTNEGQPVEFEINVSGQSPVTLQGTPIRYSYATQDGTAKAGTHYRAASGKVTLDAYSHAGQVSVTTHRDNTNRKHTVTFSLKLTDPEVKIGQSGTAPSWQSASGTGLPNEIKQTATIVYW